MLVFRVSKSIDDAPLWSVPEAHAFDLHGILTDNAVPQINNHQARMVSFFGAVEYFDACIKAPGVCPLQVASARLWRQNRARSVTWFSVSRPLHARP
jgi:hypothetical protein